MVPALVYRALGTKTWYDHVRLQMYLQMDYYIHLLESKLQPRHQALMPDTPVQQGEQQMTQRNQNQYQQFQSQFQIQDQVQSRNPGHQQSLPQASSQLPPWQLGDFQPGSRKHNARGQYLSPVSVPRGADNFVQDPHTRLAAQNHVAGHSEPLRHVQPNAPGTRQFKSPRGPRHSVESRLPFQRRRRLRRRRFLRRDLAHGQ